MGVMKKLPIKHKQFAEAYFLSGNGTASYRKVYKCAEKTANSQSSKLLKNPKVQAYLDELRDKTRDRVIEKWTATTNDILHEDSLLATHRVPGILDENGMLRPIGDWPEDVQAAIKAVEYEDVVRTTGEPGEDGTPQTEVVRVVKKIHFNDKGQALGRMEKALGIVNDDGGDTNIFDIRVILAKIDGLNRGKLPQDCN